MRKRYIYYFSYTGSKARLLHRLTVMFPLYCRTLYELCGGSGVLSLTRHGFFENHAVYNEIDEHICRLFRMLKDPNTRDELINRLTNAPCSYEHFVESQKNYKKGFKSVDDDFEICVQMFVLLTQSYMSCVEASWAGKYPEPRELRKRLSKVAAELEHIEISNLSCFKLIKAHQDNSDFLYIDPVYFEENMYNAKFNKYSHIRLAKMCLKSDAKIMISGRSTFYYDVIFSTDPRWRKYYLCTLPSPNNKGGNGKKNLKPEYIYINYSDLAPAARRLAIEVPFFKTIHDI